VLLRARDEVIHSNLSLSAINSTSTPVVVGSMMIEGEMKNVVRWSQRAGE
jgi:hypothetical protein